MYLWKVDRLIDDFRAGEITQTEQFKYILFNTVLMVLISDPFVYSGSSYNLYDLINSLCALIVSIGGVYCCYKRNKEGDNRDLIVRLVCIGLPVGIRVFVFLIPLFILIGFLDIFIAGDIENADFANEPIETTPYDIASFIFFLLVYYIYLSKKIAKVST